MVRRWPAPCSPRAPAAAAVSDIDIFNFGLRFEYLQATFYTQADELGTIGRMSPRKQQWAHVLGAHERAHVKIIKSVLGSRAVRKPFFDFRGATETDDGFTRTAVAMEDLTVALLGGVTPRIQDRGLTAALFGLLTVEARHAAWARNIVGATPAAAAFDEPRSLAAVDRVVENTRFVVQRPRTQRAASAPAHDGLMPRAPAAAHRPARDRRGRGGRRVAGRRAAGPAGSGPRGLGHRRQPPPARRPPRFVPGPPAPARLHAPPRALGARAAGGGRPLGAGARGTRVAGLEMRTPEGTANLVAVLGSREDEHGRVWVRVRLPVLPNGTTGWVPRTALGGYGTVDTRLDVDLRRLRATLFRAGRPVFRAAVGVGRAEWPTPRGTFYVRNKLARYRSPAYGPVAFGTSARSPQLTDWPAGGFVGIHGTDRPDLLPGRVSHGCIRLRNARHPRPRAADAGGHAADGALMPPRSARLSWRLDRALAC